jgi:TRAP-type mannitol/chloroaromatic compound transport system permease small subunit
MTLTNLLQKMVFFINTISEWTGRLIAWLILLMVLIIVYQASMVALFSIGSVALQELQWHLFALVFLLGAAYTLKHEDHVRIDLIYQSHLLKEKHRAWIDFLGGIFLLIPFCLLVIVASWPFVSAAINYTFFFNDSWPFISITIHYAEGSPDPGGLPYLFLLKAAIPIGFSLLMLQGVANSLASLLDLLGSQEDKS